MTLNLRIYSVSFKGIFEGLLSECVWQQAITCYLCCSIPNNTFCSCTHKLLVRREMMERHFFSILHHLSPVIVTNATVVAFALLRSSRFSFHCYTQCEPVHTQKSACKWQLRPFMTPCRKDYKGHLLMQTSFTELPNNYVECDNITFATQPSFRPCT